MFLVLYTGRPSLNSPTKMASVAFRHVYMYRSSQSPESSKCLICSSRHLYTPSLLSPNPIAIPSPHSTIYIRPAHLDMCTFKQYRTDCSVPGCKRQYPDSLIRSHTCKEFDSETEACPTTRVGQHTIVNINNCRAGHMHSADRLMLSSGISAESTDGLRLQVGAEKRAKSIEQQSTHSSMSSTVQNLSVRQDPTRVPQRPQTTKLIERKTFRSTLQGLKDRFGPSPRKRNLSLT